MVTRYISSLLSLVFLAGCGDGGGYIKVLVSSDGRLGAVEKLHVTVEHQAQRAFVDFPLAAVGTGALSMPQTFSLQFAPERRGDVKITVDAISVTGQRIASATTDAVVRPLMVGEASVHLKRIAVWKQQASETKSSLMGVWGRVGGDIYVTGGGAVLKTVDSGVKWKPVVSAVQGVFIGVTGTATDTYAITNGGELAHERGGVWSTGIVADAANSYWHMWARENHVYIAGGIKDVGGGVFLSSDFGATWTTRSVPTSWTMIDVSGCPDGSLYAVGGGRTILRSNDGGAAWMAQQSENGGFLNGVSCAAKDTVFAVGSDGAVLRTVDGGVRWEALNAGTMRPLRAVWTYGSDIIYAVGDAGTILYSSDSGRSWSADPSNTTVTLYSVWASAPDNVYAVGEAGTILHLE